MMDKQREFLSIGLLLVDGGAAGGGGNGKTFINGESVKMWLTNKQKSANYEAAYQERFGKRNCMGFKLAVSVYRKRNALQKIITTINEYRGHHVMTVVVHKYLLSVRRVQRCMRNYLACKYAKLASLSVLWDKYEFEYIKRMLEKRKALKKNNLSLKKKQKKQKDTFEELAISLKMNEKSLVEMKQQGKMWNKIDEKMESFLIKLKARGKLRDVKEDEQMGKFRLPDVVRIKNLKELLISLRKQFFQSQRIQRIRQKEFDSTFSIAHAMDLLKGRGDNISRIVNDKFNKSVVVLQYDPFYLFSQLDHSAIIEIIIREHELNDTFTIKIQNDDVSKTI